MKIVADENIPLVEHYFGRQGELVLKPGRAIQREDLLTADILLVRSVTQVNKKLLHDTAVKFVGSATTGFDHLDTAWLAQAGIQWSIAQGCNAAAVVEYVVCVIAALQKMNFLTQKKLRAGVIGAGTIGRTVAEKLAMLGFAVAVCDPLRAEQERDFVSTPLEQLADLDFISFHTPLTQQGNYPTYHLIEKNFLQRQKPQSILLNASRGAVINFHDLKMYGSHLFWCLDVWEHEPVIDLDVLEPALIATPHIAGYSVQSRYRGIEMIYEAARQKNILPGAAVSRVPFPKQKISFDHAQADWRDVVLRVFNPLVESQQMKQVLGVDARAFDSLRKNFVERCEFGFIELQDAQLNESDRGLLQQLGMVCHG